jgi:hypothetical protein
MPQLVNGLQNVYNKYAKLLNNFMMAHYSEKIHSIATILYTNQMNVCYRY